MVISDGNVQPLTPHNESTALPLWNAPSASADGAFSFESGTPRAKKHPIRNCEWGVVVGTKGGRAGGPDAGYKTMLSTTFASCRRFRHSSAMSV